MAVGMAEDLEPEIFEYRVKPGDWLLFHTDGVGAETCRQIAALQKQELGPVAASDAVVALLNQATFHDNAACSLVVF
jgi:serine phosphatase RsbU (regulator of sigma subunit)